MNSADESTVLGALPLIQSDYYLNTNQSGEMKNLISTMFDTNLTTNSSFSSSPSSSSTVPSSIFFHSSAPFESNLSVSSLADVMQLLGTVNNSNEHTTAYEALETFLSGSSPLPTLSPSFSGPDTTGLESGNTIALSTIIQTAQFENGTELFTTFYLEPDLRVHHPILAVLLGILCVVVVFGNSLTMVSIYRERYLHTVTNYFIASLAAADCLVGAIVMPFSVVHEVMNKWWIFGHDWCDIWHSFDVLASSASILNLCAISLDRYWAITDPITYPARMTPTRASFIIFGIWACSSLISFPAIVWWRAVLKEPPPAYRCNFTDDIGYLVFSSSISFYGPLTVMVFTYYRIYVIANKQTKSLKLGVKQIEIGCESNSNEFATPGGFALRMHRGGYNRASTDSDTHNKCPVTTTTVSSIEKSFASIQQQPPLHAKCSNTFSDPTSSAPANKSALISPRKTSASQSVANSKVHWPVGRRLAKLAKERKAAKTLGIVMGVFILCWMPFFITNVLVGICQSCISKDADLVFSIVTWLGWMNSALNPIIYACWSRDFRRAFRKILCSCQKSRSNLSYDRNRNYKPQQSQHQQTKQLSKQKQQQPPLTGPKPSSVSTVGGGGDSGGGANSSRFGNFYKSSRTMSDNGFEACTTPPANLGESTRTTNGNTNGVSGCSPTNNNNNFLDSGSSILNVKQNDEIANSRENCRH